MTHYVCPGDCGGESGKVGLCESEGCTREGDALIECDCDDGLHKGVLDDSQEPDVESMDDEDDF